MNPSDNIDITTLLSEKSFDELSEAEQAFALSELGSASEYEQMRAIINGVQTLDDVELDTSIKDVVMSEFDDEHRDTVPMIPINHFKKRRLFVTLAAAASLALVCTITINYLNPKSNELAENKEPIKKLENDTALVENAYKEQEKPKSSESEPLDENQNADEEQPIQKSVPSPAPAAEEIKIADEMYIAEIIVADEIEESTEEDLEESDAAPSPVMSEQLNRSAIRMEKEQVADYHANGLDEQESKQMDMTTPASQGNDSTTLNESEVVAAKDQSPHSKSMTSMSARASSGDIIGGVKLNLRITLPDSTHYTSF